MTNKTYVVRVDGGICSQLAFVAYGLELAEAGAVVKFDLSWFKECGLDKFGKQARNWDMLRLMPNLKLDIATDEEICFAKEARKGYEYVSGYPDRIPALLKYASNFKSMLKPELDSTSENLRSQILSTTSCAIHVRRGDLANGDETYGNATSLSYFERAINFERARTANKVVFYVFTDDLEWTRENIMPVLGEGAVLCINGADKGYVDLYLMSLCDAIISSIGSLGIFSAVLSRKKPVLYLSHYREWALRDIENSLFMNGSIKAEDSAGYAYKYEYQYKKTGRYKIPYKIFKYLEKKLRITAK